jgi:hypothetical protein
MSLYAKLLARKQLEGMSIKKTKYELEREAQEERWAEVARRGNIRKRLEEDELTDNDRNMLQNEYEELGVKLNIGQKITVDNNYRGIRFDLENTTQKL